MGEMAFRTILAALVFLVSGCVDHDEPLPMTADDDAGDAAPPIESGTADTSYEASEPIVEDASPAQTGDEVEGGRTSETPDAAAPPSTQSPTNTSFETAREIEVGANPALQDVVSGTQVDYFKFDGERGRYYSLSTETSTFSPDNVITLYDADHEMIAQNDNGSIWAGDGIDARLVVRLPEDGPYFVTVEDTAIPDEYFESASLPLVFYHFDVRELASGAPGVSMHGEEEAAPIEFVQDEVSGFWFATLLGEFAEGKNDVFEFVGKLDHALIGSVLTAGPTGNGSTASKGRVRITETNDHAVGEIDRAAGQQNIHPPVTEAPYRVTLIPEGEPGSNGFYAIDIVMVPDNPREQSEVDNGKLAGAEKVVMEGNLSRRGLLLSTLIPNDVDYYSFEALGGQLAYVACEAQSGGSGVEALRAELRDENDQILAFAEETPTANLEIEPTEISTAGVYYLRLSSQTETIEDLPEPWVRCGIVVR